MRNGKDTVDVPLREDELRSRPHVRAHHTSQDGDRDNETVARVLPDVGQHGITSVD